MKLRSRIHPVSTLAGCGALIVLMLPLAGCGRDDVRVYRIPKEGTEMPMLAQANVPAGHPDVSPAGQAPLTWKTPEGWTEMAPSQMRVASFAIKTADGKQADVSVIPLGGGGGGDVANVNRWRGQVGLETLSETDLQKSAQAVEVSGQPAQLYDIAGKNPANNSPTRILGVIQHRGDTGWYFKMTGDEQLVEQQKPAFIEFLKSTKFAGDAAASDAAGAASMPPGHPPIGGGMSSLPAGHPAIPGGAAATEAISHEGQPKWQVPSGWKEISGGQFLVAKFTIAGDAGAQAAVNVSTSAGDGGGLNSNVNRWRQQLGLNRMSEAEIGQFVTPIDTAGGAKALVVDFSGTDASTGRPGRLIGALVPQTGQTWFYKLMGDAKLVEREKDAFTAFVKSAKY